MTTTFKNAPLVELVAELRWTPAAKNIFSAGGAPGTVFQLSLGDSSRSEEFYMSFGQEAFGRGFSRSERIVPPGMPSIQNQCVFRFRNEGGSEMLQVGPGVFAANAVPPYKSWKEFAPKVQEGVEVLLKTRPPEEREVPFSMCLLRYIDAFRDTHVGKRSHFEFIRDVLGFQFSNPPALTKWLADGAEPTLTIQQAGTTKDGVGFTLSVGDGVTQGTPAVVMDLTLMTQEPIPPRVDEVMRALGAQRDIAHDIFVEATKRIHDKLEPI